MAITGEATSATMKLGASSMLQQLPFFDSGGAIHPQKSSRSPASGGEADDASIADLIVVLPSVNAGMEQRRQFSGFRIYRSNIAALIPVTEAAA